MIKRWIETSGEVFDCLWRKHGEDMQVFSTYSNPTGDCPLGRGYPEMRTEYGFADANFPVFRIVQTKEKESDNKWTFKYYLPVITEVE